MGYICRTCKGEVEEIDPNEEWADYQCIGCKLFYPVCVGEYGCGGPVLDEPSIIRAEDPQSQHHICRP